MKRAAVVAAAAVAAICGAAHADPRPAQRVSAVEIAGAPRGLLHSLTVLEGTLDDRDRLARRVGAAGQWLRDRGYLVATVTAQVRDAPDGGVIVHVDVVLGPSAIVDHVAIHGSALPVYVETDLGAGNALGGVLRANALLRRLGELIDAHRDRGYFDAAYGAPRSQLEDGRVSVDVDVAPGARYRLGELRMRGGTLITRARAFADLVALRDRLFDADEWREATERFSADVGGAEHVYRDDDRATHTSAIVVDLSSLP